MKIYNVMTRTKQDFAPIQQGKVSIYACGITVNGLAHLGHARQAIVFNVIVEYLRLTGYEVKYARNYTDIDDKIIGQASQLGIAPLLLADQRIDEIEQAINAIVTKDADYKPRVSSHIDSIIAFVGDLIENGHAYAVNGDVYFDVASYPQYGRLSNRNTKDMLEGVRIDNSDNKKSPLDFALWKSTVGEEFGWDSPWGRGRPGWHIECSAMIDDILGKHIDIHGGGKDLIFPHHENEIAQSCSHNNCELANYWIHNGLITVNGVKMSKSTNNFITIAEFLNQYDAEVMRMLMLSTHYSSPLEVNKLSLVTCEKHLYDFYSALDVMRTLYQDVDLSTIDIAQLSLYKTFVSAMDNDFNISLFLAELFGKFAEYGKAKGDAKRAIAIELMATLDKVYMVLGLFNQPVGQYVQRVKNKYLVQFGVDIATIAQLIEQRNIAKSAKDYAVADGYRAQLLQLGVVVKDGPQATVWEIDWDRAKQ